MERLKMNWEQIKKANETIRTTDIKGKNYAEVNQRIKAFRMVEPNGTITTEIIKIDDGVVLMKATITNENGVVIGTGYAQEKESSSFINKTSYIENCETSAVGRALGMCGFGIDASVASYEDVANEMSNQDTTTNFRELVYKVIEEKKLNVLDVARQYKLNSSATQEQFRKAYEDLCKIQ